MSIPIFDKNYFDALGAKEKARINKYKGFNIRVVKFEHTYNRFKELQKANIQLMAPEAELLIEQLKNKVLYLGLAENDDFSIRFHGFADTFRDAGKLMEYYIDCYVGGLRNEKVAAFSVN